MGPRVQRGRGTGVEDRARRRGTDVGVGHREPPLAGRSVEAEIERAVVRARLRDGGFVGAAGVQVHPRGDREAGAVLDRRSAGSDITGTGAVEREPAVGVARSPGGPGAHAAVDRPAGAVRRDRADPFVELPPGRGSVRRAVVGGREFCCGRRVVSGAARRQRRRRLFIPVVEVGIVARHSLAVGGKGRNSRERVPAVGGPLAEAGLRPVPGADQENETDETEGSAGLPPPTEASSSRTMARNGRRARRRPSARVSAHFRSLVRTSHAVVARPGSMAVPRVTRRWSATSSRWGQAPLLRCSGLPR